MSKINIKNPITIFNKVEEINGVPIEISTLDSALLVAENEGKVYKYDGKLYKIVVDESKFFLGGAKIILPYKWSATKGYGKFNIDYNISGSNAYSSTGSFSQNNCTGFNIGYDIFGNLVSNTVAIIYSSKREATSSYNLTFNILGGTDASNQNLIQWFRDNNATIEGGTYSSFILQEILSPSGTLEVTANGEYDITNYASANVNVPEVPYFDGTIEISGGLISFTIAGTQYSAEEDMTWGEWVTSSYNNGVYALNSGMQYIELASDSDYAVGTEDYAFVNSTDVIESKDYTHIYQGGGGSN